MSINRVKVNRLKGICYIIYRHIQLPNQTDVFITKCQRSNCADADLKKKFKAEELLGLLPVTLHYNKNISTNNIVLDK